MEGQNTEKRTRRGKIPFAEKLAYMDRQVKWAENKLAEFKAKRAQMIADRKAEAEAMLKETS